ncbi:MAG: hydrogenase expression/formation protein HypE, partial [Deltaproteobacteria bacterium]|nr:hydrogenase expression/formation protein HypE [Deltaproteobacteria bacterium]
PMATLERILDSIQGAAQASGVHVVTGDTKVVNRGCADQLFINTSGVGLVEMEPSPDTTRIAPGDRVLVNGTLGDHGMAILSQREGFRFESPIESDTVGLWSLVQQMLRAAPGAVHALRDPTRGGVATTLNEFAASSGFGIRIQEEALPVTEPVRAACEFLGLDPLYVANEGKLVALVAPDAADAVLAAMRAHPAGRDAAIVGTVVPDPRRRVILDTHFGSPRVVDMLSGDPLPRIC